MNRIKVTGYFEAEDEDFDEPGDTRLSGKAYDEALSIALVDLDDLRMERA